MELKNDLSQARQLIAHCLETKDPYLDLGNCGITDLNDLPELFECGHLRKLVLSTIWVDGGQLEQTTNNGQKNDISCFPAEIASLNNLEQLICSDVTDNVVVLDLTNLPYLYKLIHLNISLCNVWDISALSSLVCLTSLNIRCTNVSDVSALSSLINLTSLDISYNAISDISSLSSLVSLTSLDISSAKISDISALSSLVNLTSLYINNNNVLDVSHLSNLVNLTTLAIRSISRSSKISDDGNFITFQRDNIIHDMNFLSNMINLTNLDISHNRLSDISFLSSLMNLKSLSLNNNNISDISPIQNIANLAYLDMSSNYINSLSSLSKLKSLVLFYAKSNNITEITPLLSNSEFEILDLRDNKIKSLPKSIFQNDWVISFGKDLSIGLNLHGNPIDSPPIEIIEQGKQSALQWFEANKKKLNEIKIILIGDPKSGKTSLLKRLKDDTFNKDEVQTDGINIEHIAFGNCTAFDRQTSLHPLTAHFWDFGGQEIMNATHQFFLTNRSVYVLVLDARKDANVVTQIRNWVKRIKATGGNSPIIVVANQIDVNKAFGFINEVELKNEFPQIDCFIKVSCETGEGLDKLKHKLEEIVPQAELFNTEIDERWLSIMQQLQHETQTNHFLNEHRFNKICDENQLIEKSARKNAITFLHDLGLVLHFENAFLSEYYVLDPYWITYGVYQIVTSAMAGEQKGLVSMEDLDYIVNQEEDKRQVYKPLEYKKIQYSSNERRFLVDILNQFKLCFYLPGNEVFIIPDLLDTVEPISITSSIREEGYSISFAYEYEFLPSSVMPYIMVEAHNLIQEKWRTGCVLSYKGSRALVSTYDTRLYITVVGEYKSKREFLAIVRSLVNEVNNKLADKPKELIPLPGINAFAEYRVLLAREKKGRRVYIHDEDKPTEITFDLSQLLEGIPTPDEVLENQKLLRKILQGQGQIREVIETQCQAMMQQSGLNNISILEAMEEVSQTQIIEVNAAIISMMEGLSVQLSDNNKTIYEAITKTEDTELKLKLSIPFIKLLGVDVEASFDMKKWLKEMYEKHSLKIFKLMGYIE